MKVKQNQKVREDMRRGLETVMASGSGHNVRESLDGELNVPCPLWHLILVYLVTDDPLPRILPPWGPSLQ